MNSTNMVVIDGYLGKDSELRFSSAGFAFLDFSVAVKESRKVGEKYEDHFTHWIDCKTIGKRAEGLAKILKRGTFCVVTGRLQQETWEKDGQKRSKVVVFVENVSLGPRPATKDDGYNSNKVGEGPTDDMGDFPF